MIVLLGLTAMTAGNATGIGFVDFVPVALAEQVDWEQTYVNSFTAGGAGVRRGRMPMVLPDEESCIRAAMQTCGKPFDDAEEGRAHPLDAAPDALLGERRAARRAPCGRADRRPVGSTTVPETFFTVERRADGSEWFTPTDHARGPWDPDACHGGPPTGPARAGPRAGGTWDAPVTACPSTSGGRCRWPGSRSGPRSPAAGGRRPTRRRRSSMATARSGRRRSACSWPSPTRRCSRRRIDNLDHDTPRLAESVPGAFPVGRVAHDWPGFRGGVEIRYPPGEDDEPGLTTVWMRTVPLLPDEEMTPFQRISPLADCGNAFGRNAEPDQVQFINTDLLDRPAPRSRSASGWAAAPARRGSRPGSDSPTPSSSTTRAPSAAPCRPSSCAARPS